MELCSICGSEKKAILLLNSTVFDCVNPKCGSVAPVPTEGIKSGVALSYTTLIELAANQTFPFRVKNRLFAEPYQVLQQVSNGMFKVRCEGWNTLLYLTGRGCDWRLA